MTAATLDPPPAVATPDAGEIYANERGKPVPGYQHARTQARFIKQLPADGPYEALSELNVELNGWRCVPDVCILPRGKGLLSEDTPWVKETPLMTVEIISPSQTMDEMMTKVNRLLKEGVPAVWLIIPEVRVVTIFQKGQMPLSATHGTLTDPATGIAIEVSELFA